VNGLQTDEALGTIRRILLEPSIIERLARLEAELAHKTSPEGIGAQMRAAFDYCQKNNIELAPFFEPMVERSIEKSIESNQPRMIGILYPILGGMVRKSVVASMKSFVLSINTVIEKSFSLDGIKWRIESWLTGVPIATIALKRSFIFRVEHIFLIHKGTARLLSAASAPDAVEADRVVFAGMLETVSTFVKDVFWQKEGVWLDHIDVGEFQIGLLDSASAVLACVVRGNPPPRLRDHLDDILEKVELSHGNQLLLATPTENDFYDCSELLSGGLVSEKVAPKKPGIDLKTKLILAAAGMMTVFLVGKWLWEKVEATKIENRFASLASRMAALPDLVVTNISKNSDGTRRFQGLATNPATAGGQISNLARELELSPELISLDIKYASLAEGEKFQALQSVLTTASGDIERIALNKENGSLDLFALEQVADLAMNNYIAASKVGRRFAVLIRYPPSQRLMADDIYSRLLYLLRGRQVFDYHLFQIQEERGGTHLRLEVKSEASSES
jgi:hypothetical protein